MRIDYNLQTLRGNHFGGVTLAVGVAWPSRLRKFERLQMDSVVSVPLLDRSFFGAQDDQETVDEFSARVGLVALRGSFTVASANKLISTISVDIRDHEVVILDFSDTVYMERQRRAGGGATD